MIPNMEAVTVLDGGWGPGSESEPATRLAAIARVHNPVAHRGWKLLLVITFSTCFISLASHLAAATLRHASVISQLLHNA